MKEVTRLIDGRYAMIDHRTGEVRVFNDRISIKEYADYIRLHEYSERRREYERDFFREDKPLSRKERIANLNL